jgi:hypothetical protein
MNEDIQRKIEETLASLDGMERAEASPYLYSKIRNRMQAAKEVVPQGLAWRIVTALAIVAVVNVATILHVNPAKDTNSGVESVASEYAISLPQTY